MICKKQKGLHNQPEAWRELKRYVWTYEKKDLLIGIEEFVTFDNIQRRSCVGICLIVVCEIYNAIVIAGSFLSAVDC